MANGRFKFYLKTVPPFVHANAAASTNFPFSTRLNVGRLWFGASLPVCSYALYVRIAAKHKATFNHIIIIFIKKMNEIFVCVCLLCSVRNLIRLHSCIFQCDLLDGYRHQTVNAECWCIKLKLPLASHFVVGRRALRMPSDQRQGSIL